MLKTLHFAVHSKQLGLVFPWRWILSCCKVPSSSPLPNIHSDGPCTIRYNTVDQHPESSRLAKHTHLLYASLSNRLCHDKRHTLSFKPKGVKPLHQLERKLPVVESLTGPSKRVLSLANGRTHLLRCMRTVTCLTPLTATVQTLTALYARQRQQTGGTITGKR